MSLKAEVLDYAKPEAFAKLPYTYPSWNEIQGMNRFERTRARRKFMDDTIILLRNQIQVRFTNPVRILVDLYFSKKRTRDNDNYGGKWLIDAIVRAEILPDDSNKWIPEPVDVKIIDDEPVSMTMVKIEEIGR